ncbi:hypothetical protein BD410DRAFT_897943 [Rickenella mellea]|uniref:Uncharacterized protein n=1 Tax=Rickenella mellea TaxID=50990 RepID=A0A4Y7Q5W1_9AGAM|nr:hypothetical protein BD410DRAFT_897943 [Rickenella mellea]
MNNSRGNQRSNFVAMIQSSGTGKSRVADELGKLVFTLPFNLRDRRNLGYPSSDHVVLDFFRIRYPDEKETYDELCDRILCFMSVLFNHVERAVQDHLPSSFPSSESLAEHWREYLRTDNNRHALYSNVLHATENIWRTDRNWDDATRHRNVRASAVNFGISLLRKLQSISHPLSASAPTYHPSSGHGDVRMVLSFDETHELFINKDTFARDDRTAYDALCGAVSELEELDIFAIFLSTTPELLRNPPPRHIWPNYQKPLQVPFIELPFDQWKEAYLVTEGSHALDDVCDVEFMVRFGRPLFWTRWEAGDDTVRSDMLNFARAKINGGCDYEGGDARTAALGIRLLLEFEPTNEQAHAMQGRMVRANMRMVHAIPSQLDYYISGTPSEPLLAEAAAQNLKDPSGISWQLLQLIKRGLLSEEDRSELVTRVLLTEAHDLALKDMGHRSWSVSYSVPIPVVTFLKALFSERYIELVLDCRPDDDPNGEPLQEAFKNSFIHFTHFGRGEGAGCVSDLMASMGLYRGMAFACRKNSGLCDILLPILVDGKRPISQENSTIGLISLKDTFAKKSANMDAFEGEFFSLAGVKRPYLNLIMRLGGPRRSEHCPPIRGAFKNTYRETNQDSPSHSAEPQPTPGTDRDDAVIEDHDPQTADVQSHPRYSINAFGCSSDIYRAMEEHSYVYKELVEASFVDGPSTNKPDYSKTEAGLDPSTGTMLLPWSKRSDTRTEDAEIEKMVEGVFLGRYDKLFSY